MKKGFALAAFAAAVVLAPRDGRACPPSKPDAFIVAKVLASDSRIGARMDDSFPLSGKTIDVPTQGASEFAASLRATLGGKALKRVEVHPLEAAVREGPSARFEIPGDPARFDGAILALTAGGRVVARLKVDFEKGLVKPCVIDSRQFDERPKALLAEQPGAPLPLPASAAPPPVASSAPADSKKTSGCAFARAVPERNGATVFLIAFAAWLWRLRLRQRYSE